jgi:hypothetical protein
LCDQRYTWAHLFAAVRPATGDSFALVMPRVSTEAMQAFLDRFSAALAPDEHAAMAVDGAGWHVAHALRIPDNVTLVLLPPYSPCVDAPCGSRWASRRRSRARVRSCVRPLDAAGMAAGPDELRGAGA